MILKCKNCKEKFVASYDQRKRAVIGRKIFMCSLSCRGQYGKRAHNEKNGLKPMPTKKLARSRVRGALLRGDVKKSTRCQQCGKSETALQAHHYAGHEKALLIQWLCVPCHAVVDAHLKVRGETHSQAKLSNLEVSQIRKRLAQGGSLQGTANEFSVSKKTIINIKYDRIWRHVA